jgi:hypothetical protein
MIVLGSFPEYLEEASRRGANALTLTARVWQFLGNNGDQWTTFKSFLDASRHTNQEILLVTNPATISSGSMGARELAHLLDQGFRLDSTGNRVVRVK